MKRMNLSILGFLALIAVAVLPSVSMAAPSMTPLPALAKPLNYMPIADQIGAQLQNLVATPASAAGEEVPPDEANQEPSPTFGTRALNVVINVTEILRTEAVRFVEDFGALPQLSNWIAQQRNDPRFAARWQSTGSTFVATAGIACLIALVLETALYPLRHAIRRRTPRNLTAKIMFVVGLLFLRALPIVVFVSASVILLNQNDAQKLPRFLIMNIVYALALARITVSLLRGILSPRSETLRFVPATTAQAQYGFRWLTAFSLLIIFGYFCADVTHSLRVPNDAVTAFVNVIALILVRMAIVVITQKRAFVAQLLRGNLSAAQSDLSWFDSLRLWFARHWHKLAIAYLVIGYMIAATGVQDGLSSMLRGTVLTLVALVVSRLLFREIGLREARAQKGATTLYTMIKGLSLRFIIVVIALGCILSAWGANLVVAANSALGHRILGSVFSVGVTCFILGLIYEYFCSAVDRRLNPTVADGKVIEVNARSRTLLPMLRNALFLVLTAIIGVMVLSEAGINIGPLLAGAGVLGVAVGFGSQTLVKDFLTGLFIVVENTIAVGDVIKIGDHSGVVETMSMRTLRLRDTDGAQHILPFSEVSKIINYTKSFSFAVIKVNVATDADLDKAIDCIRAVGEALHKDDATKYSILEPTEILGVDSINENSVTLMARIRTRAGKQWEIKRLYLLRLKQAFDAAGIKLSTTATIRIERDALKSTEA